MERDTSILNRMLVSSTLVFALGFVIFGRIEQPQWYHDFADNRTFFGIPNAVDVLSNLALLIPGVVGLALVKEMHQKGGGYTDRFELVIMTSLFGGIILTFMGSVWYHLEPNDSTMIWDRMPMTIVFASICSLVIADRMGVGVAKKVHVPLMLIGILSVLLWHWTGDLRPFFFFKHEPLIIIVILLIFGKATYDREVDYFVALSLFLLATVFELTDSTIYGITSIISGHTVKHILAGVALWILLRMIQTRTMLNPHHPSSAEE